MNKTAIKNFAISARRKLIEGVEKKAQIYGIEKNNIKEEIETTVKGDLLTSIEKKERQELIKRIKNDGFDEVIEEIAYTWFNRFIAIRFMEVNGYLLSHVRVFSSEDGKFNPEILKECLNLDFESIDNKKLMELFNSANKEELFKYLFVAQCNELSEVLPGMFEKISDFTELLLPDGLLKDDSVIKSMVEDIPEEDWMEQVQILGWMYQYYNTEPKKEIFSRPKSKKIEKEDIPAATQLFTPDWIVKYMVENSLGRLWIEGHPNEELKKSWKYYVEEAEQEEEVKEKLKEIRKEYSKLEPMDIKCIDPSIGSGHIGCYLFDVLIQIYESYGYKRRDAARLIVENNIYGFDIDERARQFAYFSIMMKARQYDRRFLSRGIKKTNIYSISESNIFNTKEGKEAIEYFANGKTNLRNDILSILEDMIDAKEYGSIINIRPVNFNAIYDRLKEIEEEDTNLYNLNLKEDYTIKKLKNLVEQAKVLSDKYDVVVTNPPYMGSSGMDTKLSKYVKENYKDSKSDLFAVFMEKCKSITGKNRFLAMITQHAWMFLSSYEKLREKFRYVDIVNMAHLGSRAFEEIGGEVVQTTSFIYRCSSLLNYKSIYKKITDPTSQSDKEKLFLKKENKYIISKDNFKKIPGMPIAYWISDKVIYDFEKGTIADKLLDVRQGLATGNNDKYIRLWHEVNNKYIKTNISSMNKYLDYIEIEDFKYVFLNKGGPKRKWYGNISDIIKFDKDSYRELLTVGNKLPSREYYFKDSITWGKIASSGFSIRYRDYGSVYDGASMAAFYNGKVGLKYTLGLMCSKIASYIFRILNPTVNIQAGDFKNFPILTSKENEDIVEIKVSQNILLSKLDWDMHETSWDFEKSSLLKNKKDGLIESAYKEYKSEVNNRFDKLKENEEELNRIFIDIYGLEEELTPEVSDKDITVAKIFDTKDDIYEEIKGNKYIMTKEDVIKNFLSYFVGCAMGRYSLDEDGLVFAGGEFDNSKYKTFKADEDGILPITDEEYFEDDMVVRFEEFLKVTFGEEHLNENLDFIASELKGKASESSRDKIRNYFIKDFYKDHCKMYQKCPIYWMFDSGKLGASRNLLYMHRYEKDSIARLRIRYVFEIQDRYKQELARLEKLIDGANGTEQVKYKKQADNIKKRITETEKYEEKVQHLADSYIEMDLDEGVEKNYKLFEDILADRKK